MSRRLISRLLSLVCILCALSLAAHAADDATPAGWDLGQLMAALARVEQVDAVFEERKELAALETPLVSSGVLRYRAPSLLEKDVMQPQPARYRIDGDRVSIDAADAGRRDFGVDEYPGVRVLIESIRATLAGDRATLERYFHIDITGNRNDWSLRLQPVDPDIARRVIAIVIGGADDRVLRIETRESGDDRSVMTITSTAK